jgi:hypothetical protein
MTEIEELETHIRNLPKEDFLKFRDWFYQLEDELWDQEIKSDFKAGKFDKLIKKAQAKFVQGKARKL